MLKQCSKCKEYKTLDRFYKNKRTKDGLDGRCADCHEKIRKKYLFSEKGIERRIAWLSQNRKHIQKYNNNYYTEHKEFVLGLSKQWRKLHREHNNKISNRGWRKRRERKLGLKEAELTDKEIDILFNVFGAECANCGAKDRLQMDHPILANTILSMSAMMKRIK